MRVAILVSDGFEPLELLDIRKILDDAGAAAFIISPAGDKVEGWNQKQGRREIPVDISLKSAKAEDFHTVLLPGGMRNAEHLRMNVDAVQFVNDFMKEGKPVAAIGEGLWTILQAGALRGRTVTSAPSLRTDLQNAGANWVDKEVVCDGKLITSRTPDDIPAFNREIVRLFAEVREHSTDMRKIA
jgi:protease I